MDRKGKIVAINPISHIDFGSPNGTDHPQGQMGAIDLGKRAWSGAAWQVKRLSARQTATIATDLRAGGTFRGNLVNLIEAERQRLTIIHNGSKLPPNFGNRYRQLPITPKTHWWTWPI